MGTLYWWFTICHGGYGIELRWLPFASEQLRADIQYVVDNFGEITAKKSLRRILDKVNELRKNPDIGIWDKKFSLDVIKVRHLNIDPNMVLIFALK